MLAPAWKGRDVTEYEFTGIYSWTDAGCIEEMCFRPDQGRVYSRRLWGGPMTPTDPLWMKVTLGLHVASGSMAFVLAPIALITAKGGKAHRRWGLVYFYAMAGVAVSAMVMALYRPLLFLALVAIFSFYSAFLAYRVLGQKAAYQGTCRRLRHTMDWTGGGMHLSWPASSLAVLWSVFRPAHRFRTWAFRQSFSDC